MADSDQDESQKTEEPTPKRLDDALKKGQVAFSREVTSFGLLLVFTLLVVWLFPSIMTQTVRKFSQFISTPHLFRIDGDSVIAISAGVAEDYFAIMFLPFLGLILIVFLSSFLQNGIVFSGNPLIPQLNRISPLKGIKRMFSIRSFLEFIKGLIKITLVGAIGVIAVYPELSNLEDIIPKSPIDSLKFLGEIATRLLIGVTAAMGLIAVLDLIYQRFEHSKSLRMSKRDLKEELRQTEGNPEIKAKLREIRNERAKKRMMNEVPSSDVVITNPTHYSVALRYDLEVASAPVVVAKGKDFIALKIREIAKENDVPLVENPPLARALFNSVDLDEEIPVEHYNAVAEVIRYVYKLKGKTVA